MTISVPVRVTGFPKDAKSVTPDDSLTVDNAMFGNQFANLLWVGDTNDVRIVKANPGTTAAAQQTLTMSNVTSGEWHPMPPFRHVRDTGTDASEIFVGIAYD